METSSRVETRKFEGQRESQGERKTVAIAEKDLGSGSGDETKIIGMGLKNIKGKEIEIKPSSSISNCHIEALSEEKRI